MKRLVFSVFAMASLVACEPPAGRPPSLPPLSVEALFEPGEATPDPGSATADVRAPRRLPVPDSWTATVPDGWRWAADSRSGGDLALGYRPSERGEGADALVWIVRPRVTAGALDRFLADVAPALLPPPRGSLDAHRNLGRTAGLGIGFEPRTFSGWRHLGRTPRGVTLLLAQLDGIWRSSGGLDPSGDLDAALEDRLWDLVGRLPFDQADLLGDVLRRSPSLGNDRSARMVLGRVGPPRRGLFVALLCRLPCDTGADLDAIVDSLGPRRTADPLDPVDATPTDLGLEIGLGLLPAGLPADWLATGASERGR